MSYRVKEIFYTLQGEGAQTGRPAVFCRFAGCNLWSGREQDRERAVCTFCDTDFRGTDGEGGGRFRDASELADRIRAAWLGDDDAGVKPYVVCTGGEPLLQLDAPLIAALRACDCEIAVETNGTCPAPSGLDWICVSPKASAELRLTAGDELKLVYPQPEAPPERFEWLDFRHFFLQPMDDPHLAVHTAQAIDYCKAHPRWRLSMQTHKLLGIP
ncbi:7-carboxy-7-deazaguanine synthase [Thiocystis minor]|uniref:7-carboxy-7-deazaguanine synthase n=1 Tax=Thiocystis minor TaxID=61597 RepID=UPI001914CFF3|nr:7-carboxy-7-deazaguanine synthase [Thiocystis minor]MBK5962601.1 7-carboxy-7-deazaguanine synthase [Thiocystis minor]